MLAKVSAIVGFLLDKVGTGMLTLVTIRLIRNAKFVSKGLKITNNIANISFAVFYPPLQ